MEGYQAWYAVIEKPFFAPAPEVFGIAWGIIYPLIAISLVLTLIAYLRHKGVSNFTLALFVGNMVLNVLFTPIQLTFFNNYLTSLVILGVFGTLCVLVWRLWGELRFAAWLLVPYLLWGAFATVLQLSIAVLNA